MPPRLSLLSLLFVLLPSLVVAPPPPSPNPVAAAAQLVLCGSARITVLADGLVRIEQRRNETAGAFDDLATFAVVNRLVVPPPVFAVSLPNASAVVVTTARLRVTYVERGVMGKDACSAVQANTSQSGGTAVTAFPAGTTVATLADCCALCGADRECTSWTFSPLPVLNCFLFLGASPQASAGSFFGARTPATFPTGSLRIDFLGDGGGDAESWTPEGSPRVSPDNLGGSNPFLDCYSTPMQCAAQYVASMGPGLLSRSGWALFDDTDTGRLVPGPSANTSSWWAAPQTDNIDWYFAYTGPADHRVALAAWVLVSGAPAVPPRSALGVWWSRYFPYSDRTIASEVLSGFANHSLPLSNLVLDMGWHTNYFPGEGPWQSCSGWGGFDPNTTLFPDFASFAAQLRDNGLVLGHPLTLSLNLHLNSNVDACQLRYRAFCEAIGVPWQFDAPALCDLGNRAYADALFAIYLDAPPLSTVALGGGAYWNDCGGCGSSNSQLWMNKVFFDHAEVERGGGGGRGLTFARYGDGDGVSPGPLNLGMQRYPMGFTGDSFQHESTLSWQIESTPQSANTLFGWHSHDIGGNHNGSGCAGDEDPGNFTGSELLLRWVQHGALSPVLRTHCGYCERRAWVFARHATQLFDALRLRNMLVPYLYSEALREFLAGSGVVPVRPLYHDFAADPAAYMHNSSYLFGARIITAPLANISIESEQNGTGAVRHSVYLPDAGAGAVWSDWSGVRAVRGPALDEADYGLADVPLFSRAALLPLATLSSQAGNVADPLLWAVFLPTCLNEGGSGASAASSFTVLEDDSATNTYRSGAVAATSATVACMAVGVTLTVAPTTGAFAGMPAARGHALQVRGGPGGKAPASVAVNGVTVPPGRGVPGFYVAADAANALTEPPGTLVVNAGPGFPLDAPVEVAVTW